VTADLDRFSKTEVRRSGTLDRLSRVRIDHTDTVEEVGLVRLGWGVASSLFRYRVHNHRAIEVAGPDQSRFHIDDAVTVDRTDVLQPEVLEHSLRRHDVLDALLDSMQRAVGGPAQHRRSGQDSLTPIEEPLIAISRAQRRQMGRDSADRRRVGPLVVVDDDDHLPVRGAGNVVQRLPGHPTGQRAVTDYGHHKPMS
jgi:hypothetical protein